MSEPVRTEQHCDGHLIATVALVNTAPPGTVPAWVDGPVSWATVGMPGRDDGPVDGQTAEAMIARWPKLIP